MPGLPTDIISAGTQALGGLIKVGAGFGQIAHAKKLSKNNKRPFFDIQQEYFNNQSLSESLAQEGLPESTKAYYQSQADRGVSAGIDATLQAGGSVNDVGDIYDRYEQGIHKLAAADAQAKVRNIEGLMERNEDLAAQKVQQWVLNKYEPFKDTARAAAQERSAGLNNIVGGVQDVGSAAAIYGQSRNYADMTSNKSTQPPAATISAAGRYSSPSIVNMMNAPDTSQAIPAATNATSTSSDETLQAIMEYLNKRKV